MTINDIADYALRTIGLTDDASRANAKAYARERMKLIWNAARWKDAIGFWQGAPFVDDNGRAYLDVPLERVISIRRGDLSLAPVAFDTVFQMDARAFDTAGDTLAFTELGKVDGKRRVQLFFPPGDLTVACLVMGKLPCPELADGDEVPLTGCDNALCELTLGDMYRADSQLSKASSCFQNGMGMVEQMRQIETEQAAFAARIVPTVYPEEPLF